MENNEIMNTSGEMIETTAEEITKSGSSGVKVAAGFGLGVLAGVLAYKFGKQAICKIKHRRKRDVVDAEDYDITDVDDEEDSRDK